MLRTRLQYATFSLVLVVLSYWAYAVCAVPWIEPAAIENDPIVEERPHQPLEKPNARYRSLLTRYFPADSWEVNEAHVVKNSEFILLLQSLETLDDGRRLELPSCTVVYLRPDDGADAQDGALILRAREGALLEFDKPFDWKTGGNSKLQSGILRGKVTIESHGALGDEGNLLIHTNGVQLNRDRLWAPNQVDIQWGQHRIQGRDMTVQFVDPKSSSNAYLTDSVTSNIRSIELVEVDLLRFMAPQDLFNNGMSPGATQTRPARDDETTPIEISCGGHLLIDLFGRVATLEGQVRIVHQLPDGRSDQLDCDVAALHFLRRHRIEPAVKTADRQDAGDAKLPDFELISMTALGSPAHLDLPSFDIDVRGRSLEYNLRDRRILMADAQECYVRYGRHVVRSPRIDVRFPADESLVVDASGPGRYDHQFGASPEETIQVRWRGALRVQPDKGLQALSLTGGARIEATGWGFLAAQEVHLWAKRIVGDDGALEGSESGSNEGWTPNRIFAEGNVAFDSPRLGGRTETLQIWLDKHDTSQRAPTASQLTLNQPVQDGMHLPANDAGSHFMLRGDKINAEVASLDDEMLLQKVTVRGSVQFRETDVAGTHRKPFAMNGQTLLLEGVTRTTGIAEIYGAPAIVQARGIEVEATEIHLDRAKNHVWINVPGTVAIPLPPEIAMEFARPDAAAYISWQGRMDFDGQTVSCFRNIELSSPSQLVQAQSLQAALTQPIDLSQSRIDTKNISVGQIQLAGNVWIENKTFSNNDDDGGLASIEHALLRQVTIDHVTGEVRGQGPGSISSVRRGRAAVPGQQASQDGMTYLQVDFREGVDGNIAHREFSFLGNVRAIYGPVDAWNRVLDVTAELPPDSPNIRMQCERLSIAQMAPGDLRAAPLEFIAKGHTRVEGRTFTAEAERISYDQGKDLLVIEGDERNLATLWSQSSPGEPRTSVTSRHLQYWPHSNTMKGTIVSSNIFGLQQ